MARKLTEPISIRVVGDRAFDRGLKRLDEALAVTAPDTRLADQLRRMKRSVERARDLQHAARRAGPDGSPIRLADGTPGITSDERTTV